MAKPKAPKNILDRASKIAQQIDDGAAAHEIGGRRMRHDRTLISVSFGKRWRVVARDVGDRLEYVGLMSHEDYSRGAKAGRR